MKKATSEVQYIDHMGSDLRVVDAARVSFARDSISVGDGDECHEYKINKLLTKVPVLKPRDVSLIRYLTLHDHWTPFGHATIQFRIKAPVFVARQLVKHQVGGVWNEESRRYIDSEPEFYDMPVLRKKAENKKQGSSDEPVDISPIYEMEDVDGNCVLLPHEIEEEALETYKSLLSLGVAPEQARAYLPQSAMVNWYWTGSLAFFLRVINLRCKPDAQRETQEVASQISEVVRELFPVSWYFNSNKYELLRLKAQIECLEQWAASEQVPTEVLSKLREVKDKYDSLYNPDVSVLY